MIENINGKRIKMQSSTKKAKKLLRRPIEGQRIAGVAMAFANYFEIDIIFVRLLWILALIPGGFPGLIAYIICWIVIPEEE